MWSWWGGGTRRGPKDDTARCRSWPPAAAAPRPPRASSGLASLRKPFLGEPTCPGHSAPGKSADSRSTCYALGLLAVLREEVSGSQCECPLPCYPSSGASLFNPLPSACWGKKRLWHHTVLGSSPNFTSYKWCDEGKMPYEVTGPQGARLPPASLGC